MMGEHLVVILPPLLDVDNNNLLDPECQLHKVIPLESSRHLARRPMGPQIPIVKPICGRAHDILPKPSARLTYSKDHSEQLLGHIFVPCLGSKRPHNTTPATLALRIVYTPSF